MNWRKWNRIIHRDVGYIAFGLTMVYAISGFAVNHIHDWNPNYSVEQTTANVGHIADISTDVTNKQVTEILQQIGVNEPLKKTFPTTPEHLQIFVENQSIMLNVVTGNIEFERAVERPLLKAMNDLHLNNLRGAWTIMADLFAVTLIFLAISGIIMIKGKKGFAGRGKWLTAVGILIPIVFLWLM